VAFACRYGHIGYVSAMQMPVRDLNDFNKALAALIKEEGASLSLNNG
jgi:acyl-homoserine lactone acylase PvdQ